MPRLIYIGPDPSELGVVPLKEGWPAFDHDEDDEDVIAEKLAHRVKLPSTTPDGVAARGGPVYRLDEEAGKTTTKSRTAASGPKDSAHDASGDAAKGA